MLLEIVFRDIESSVIVRVDKFSDNIMKSLPFESKALIWKQEVYFSTPIEIDGVEDIYRVERGKVYYWKPGKALCLFYGISQVYTPAIYIGEIIDPLNRLYGVSEGYKIKVYEHRVHSEFSDIVKLLKDMGYSVATPLDSGNRIIVALRYVDGFRISFAIYVEEYGLHLESEAISRYSDDISSFVWISKLKKLVEENTDIARLDITEDNLLTVTVVLRSIDELRKGVLELEKALTTIYRYLVT